MAQGARLGTPNGASLKRKVFEAKNFAKRGSVISG